MELLQGPSAPRVTVDEWKVRCQETAARLPGEGAKLAAVLFADRPTSSAVEYKFLSHPIDTRHFDSRGRAAKLSNLTPPSYWRDVYRLL